MVGKKSGSPDKIESSLSSGSPGSEGDSASSSAGLSSTEASVLGAVVVSGAWTRDSGTSTACVSSIVAEGVPVGSTKAGGGFKKDTFSPGHSGNK